MRKLITGPVGAELFRVEWTEGRTDWHEKANNRSSGSWVVPCGMDGRTDGL